MILIISNKSDIHCNPVIEKFNAQDVPYFRLNTDCLAKDYEITFKGDGESCLLRLKNLVNNKVVNFDEITAIWERRPSQPELEHIDSNNFADVLFDEFDELRWWLRTFIEPPRVLGNVKLDRVNENKFYQIATASKVLERSGISEIKVPPTLVSNNRLEIIEFISNNSNSERFALKPIYADSVLIDDDKELVFWTGAHEKQEILSELKSDIISCPIHLQPYLEKQYELRVTLIAEDVITCKIESQKLEKNNGREDWRKAPAELVQTQFVETPKPISEFCKFYSNAIGTNFGCFDFIFSQDGTYFFLECNPNGQWMWLEDDCGAPISSSIASYLSYDQI